MKVIFLLAFLGLAAYGAEPVLERYDCEVRVVRPGRAEVGVRVEAREVSRGEALEHTLVIYDGQEIFDLRATTASGETLTLTARKAGRMLRLEIPSGELAFDSKPSYRLSYRIEAPALPGGAMRIPLAVPGAGPPSGQRPVQLAVKLPPGYRVIGDTFPPLAWADPGEGRISLAGVPSFIKVTVKPDSEVSWLDMALTASVLNDAAILALILSGSLAWLMGRRKAGA